MISGLKWFCGLALGIILVVACNDNDDVTSGENTLPPGSEYVKEGRYCLNVFYYIPKGVDTVADWHKQISSNVLWAQSMFGGMMTSCGYGGKSFHLQVNQQNPAYVKVIRLEGSDTVSAKITEVITADVDRYMVAHPEDNQSGHTLVIAPGAFYASVIRQDMDGKTTGSAVIFSQVSADNLLSLDLLRYMGDLFFLPSSDQLMSDVYYSFRTTNPKVTLLNMELKKADGMWLNQNQIFNDDDKPYYSVKPKVTVGKVGLKYEDGQIRVNCEFTSEQNVVGVIVYNDPWNNDEREANILDVSAGCSDAIPVATEEVNKNGSQYSVAVTIPWKDIPASYKVPMPGMEKREGEIRFRFLFEGGLAVPMRYKGDIKSGLRYPYNIKNMLPDFNSKVDVELTPDDQPETE